MVGSTDSQIHERPQITQGGVDDILFSGKLIASYKPSLAARGIDLLEFHIGEPTYVVPAGLQERAAALQKELGVGYTDIRGHPLARQTIARHYAALTNGDPDAVLIASGTEGLALASRVIGGSIIVPDPAWPICAGAIRESWAHAVPVSYLERGVLRLERLEAAITEETTAIVVNSPLNPTGEVLSAADRDALVSFANDHALYVFSDEAYAFTVPNFVSPCVGAQRFVCTESAAKSLAQPRLRTGVLISTPAFIASAGNYKRVRGGNTNVGAEAMLAAAIELGMYPLPGLADSLAEKMRLATEAFAAAGIEYIQPGGGFFVAYNCGREARQFRQDLLWETGVATVPLTSFATNGRFDTWIRWSVGKEPIARSREGLERAIEYQLK
jgi:aspartate/methionine/tyrosine aminotransferase